jgi:hypothetical protein
VYILFWQLAYDGQGNFLVFILRSEALTPALENLSAAFFVFKKKSYAWRM